MKLRFPVHARILTTSIAALVATTETGNAAAWVGNIDGNWSDPTRWTGGVPNGIDAIADASGIDITANRTITVDGNFTVGTLRFADAAASHDWVLAPPAGNTTNTLTLDVSTGRPTLDVLNRAVTAGVILAGNEGLAKAGAGTAFLTQANTYTGDTTVTAGGLILGSGGSVGSLQTERVINSVVPPSAAGGGPGGFEIRRADAYTVPFVITNPGNNRSAGSLTINSGNFSTATTGVTINGLVRQANIHVGRIGQFGRLFLETGADIDVDFYSFGEQSGRTGQGIQNGGNVVIGNRMQVGHWPQADPLTGTANTTTPNSYTMNGGTLTIVGTFTGNPNTAAPPEKAGIIYLGIDSTGELIVNGGTINTKAIVLDNRGATNGIDRLTINGGTVRVGGVGPGNDADLNNIGSAIISNNTSSTYAVGYNGGVIQASGNFLHAVDAVLENTSGGIAFDSNGNVITVTGALSGGGGLRKTGAGTLLMKGVSSYTGTTIVDGGVFSLVGNISSAVEVNNGGAASGAGDGISTGVYGNILVNAGGALAPGMFGTAGSIGTLAATSVTSGGDARFDLSPTATTPGGGVNDLIAVGGPLTFSAGSTVTPIFSALPTSGNIYTLFTSTARTGTPTLSLQSASRLTFALDTTTQPNNVLLSVSGSGASLNLTWRGDGTTNSWDINSSAHWNNNTERFFQLDTVAFDDTGTNTPPINLVGLLQPAAMTVAGIKDYTFGGTGTISGPGGLTKTGTGVLTIIGGGHDFSGPVSVTGGTVVISALRRAGQPSSLGAGSVLNLDGATVRYTGPSTSTDRTVTLNGTGATFDLVESTALVSLNTAVAGTGKLTKSGLGTLVLPAGNSYAGGTDVLRGAVHISGNDRALGDGFEVRLDNGALLEMNGATGVGATRRYDIIIGASGGTLSNTGAAVVNNPIYRSITMQGNLTIHTNSRYDLNGGDVDGTGVTINGELFSITKTGTGETWWSPNFGAAIGDIIVNGGTFGVQSSANLGSDAHSITVNPPGQLFTFSAVSNTKPVVLNGALLAANNSTGTWLGTVTLNGAGTSNRIGIVNNGVGVTIGGQLTGPGGFERVNGGTVELQNPTNNWFGETLLSAGVLLVSTPGAFSPNSALNIAGGTLDLALTEQTAAGLRGSLGMIQGGGGLTINQTQDATFNGTITDTVALTKAGPATLILTATNPTSGTATVTAGTLMVNGSVAGNVAINGGILAGHGTVGPVALNALGTLAPGDGRGILDSGNTTFNGGTFALEIAGPALDTEYDQLNVTGTFNLAANTTLALTLGYDPADFSHTFTIISNDGVDPLTRAGLFSYNAQLLAEGAIFSVGSQLFQITYAGGSDTNDVVLSAIPEPAGCAILLAGLSSLLGLQRPRRRAR